MSDCILAWPKRHAYAMANHGGKRMKAHRAAWIAVNGPIPPGMLICHKCDVRACINVEHLFMGTQSENMRDMVAKGRHRGPGKR